MTKRRIALLRGINVGRNRRVGMAELRAVLGDAGYAEVRTHLQSGNVVLTSGASPERLEAALERTIAAGLGVDVDVVVRTRDELSGVVERNALAGVAGDPSRYLVHFMRAAPDPARLLELEREDLGADRFELHGRELYTWHPAGIAESALATLLSRRGLGVTSTARNWNTVTKLLELADA